MGTLLAFVVTLSVLIAVHEWGHFQVARWCGVKVLRFSLGFGRVLWRYQRHPEATEFTLSMLPLGGYVRMLDSREGPVPAQQQAQAFDAQPLIKRAMIVAAGPLANLLLAVLLYAGVYWVGPMEPMAVLSGPAAGTLAADAGLRSGDWVRAVSSATDERIEVRSLNDLQWQLSQALAAGQPLTLELTDRQGDQRRSVTLALDRAPSRDPDPVTLKAVGLPPPYADAVIGAMQPDGPAQRGGLREGDVVLAIDATTVEDAAALRARIRSAPGVAQHWHVRRADMLLDLTITPRRVEEGERVIGRIDAHVGQPPQTVKVQLGWWDGWSAAFRRVGDTAVMSVQTLGRMLVGKASLRNLSGPVTIADYAGQTARLGWTEFLSFLAAVSIGLGVLNLLPLPVLDGGHLMYYLFEGVTGRPVSDLWLKRLQRGGVLMLLLMMSIALSNDLARVLGLH